MLASVSRTLPVTAIAALLVVACGAAAPTAAPTKAPASAVPAPTRSSAPTVAPTAASPTSTRSSAPTATVSALPAKPSGKVTIVIADAANQPLDPHKLIGGAASVFPNLMFDGMVGLDMKSHVEGRLATAWEVSQGATVWDFKLRPGVKFHNGDALTAEDVKFSFDKLKADTITSGGIALGRRVDTVQVVDALTVRIRTKLPLSNFEYLGAGTPILPKGYSEKIGAEKFAKEAPVGTGPFKFVDRRLDEFLSVEAFESYWRGAPFVKGVTVRFAAEPSVRVAMLKTGEADVMGGVTPPQAQEINNTRGLRTIKALRTGLMWFWPFGASTIVNGINTPKPDSPWANKLVRQAANYAVDRDAIIKGLFQGDAEPMVTLVGPDAFGFNPNLKPYSYDPKKARELLAQAGYPDGFTTDLYSTPHAAINFTEETTVAVAKFFADVGIKSNVKRMDYGTYLFQVQARKIDGIGVIASSLGPEGSSPLDTWASTRNWASPGLDGRINDGLDRVYSEGDRAKRAAMLQELVALDYENASSVWIVYGNTTYGLNSRIRAWQLRRGSPYVDRVELLQLAE